MTDLKEFFDAERKKVFAPDAFFAQRVIARLRVAQARQRAAYGNEAARESGIWDAVSVRPVVAFALTIILCIIAIAALVPQMPQRGIVESFLAPERDSVENFLYYDTDVPSRPVVLQELIGPEEQQ